jgi:hypothetical protein
MVLGWIRPGRVGRRRISHEGPDRERSGLSSFCRRNPGRLGVVSRRLGTGERRGGDRLACPCRSPVVPRNLVMLDLVVARSRRAGPGVATPGRAAPARLRATLGAPAGEGGTPAAAAPRAHVGPQGAHREGRSVPTSAAVTAALQAALVPGKVPGARRARARPAPVERARGRRGRAVRVPVRPVRAERVGDRRARAVLVPVRPVRAQRVRGRVRVGHAVAPRDREAPARLARGRDLRAAARRDRGRRVQKAIEARRSLRPRSGARWPATAVRWCGPSPYRRLVRPSGRAALPRSMRRPRRCGAPAARNGHLRRRRRLVLGPTSRAWPRFPRERQRPHHRRGVPAALRPRSLARPCRRGRRRWRT